MRKLTIGIILSIFAVITFLGSPKQSVFADEIGTWSSAGTQGVGRDSFVTVKLSSGNVITAGGHTTTYVSAVNQYNWLTNSWQPKANMKDGRYSHTGNVIKLSDRTDRVLVIGGRGGPSGWPGAFLNTAELYNPVTNTWVYTANPMASPHSLHTSTVLLDGKVLVAGGYISGIGKTSAVDIYDPVANSWSVGTPMPEAKAYHAATLLDDGRLFIVGGQITNANLTVLTGSTAFYDQKINLWTSGPNLNAARQAHQSVLLNDGRVMVIGGTTTGSIVTNSVEIWSPETNSWTTVNPMIYRRTGHTATLLQNGKVLVVGGTGGLPGASNVALNSAEIYDPATDQWHLIDPMVTPRRGHTATLLDNGSVLVVDGLSTNGLTNTSEIFTPVAPSPTPTILPTPTPEVLGEDTVAPFLDLPFDYQSLGKSFEQVALNPNSWFDHMYPLQNISCCVMKVLKYTGIEEDEAYRSHSGYDYASQNGVEYQTPVLAAASGSAIFIPSEKSSGAGNMIKIDHGNGYQTWYEHLDNNGLVVSTEEQSVQVLKGQKIGETGFTGNIFPRNKYGAHIHFSVFKDENNNGSFTDDYPYGLVDPFGWEGEQTDPWTEYGTTKHGAKSYNLFAARELPKSEGIPTTGGAVSTENITVEVPEGAAPQFFTISVKNGPFENTDDKKSIMPSFFLNAFNSLGDAIIQFFQPIRITYDYADADLLNIDEDSLKIYRYNEELSIWEALPSNLDKLNKKIVAETNHFSRFAVMGRVKDKVAPNTEVVLSGDNGQDMWYRSFVYATLLASDNLGGLGVEGTIYTLDGEAWFDYLEPLFFENDGDYTITYQSRDIVGNEENQKTTTFHIDTVIPEAEIVFDVDKQEIVVSGVESSDEQTITKETIKNKRGQIRIIDKAGNELILQDIERERGVKDVLTVSGLVYNGTLYESGVSLSVQFKKDKNGQIKEFKQIYSENGEERVVLNFNPKTSSTTIMENRQKIQVSGMKLLRLVTDEGNVAYSVN